jgi:phosphoglycerate dehydrogenase-like enzyme
MALQRQFPAMRTASENTKWTQLDLRPKLRCLEATNVVILGFGAIGQRIAELLHVFGARVTAVARSARQHPNVERVAASAELDALLPQADAVVMALPADASTTDLMDSRRISLLGQQAVIVNVGRGETIDETALAAALKSRKIAGAGLDVFRTEPLPANSPLWGLDNLILSPHVAGMGRSRLFDRMVEACVTNARAVLAKAS